MQVRSMSSADTLPLSLRPVSEAEFAVGTDPLMYRTMIYNTATAKLSEGEVPSVPFPALEWGDPEPLPHRIKWRVTHAPVSTSADGVWVSFHESAKYRLVHIHVSIISPNRDACNDLANAFAGLRPGYIPSRFWNALLKERKAGLELKEIAPCTAPTLDLTVRILRNMGFSVTRLANASDQLERSARRVGRSPSPPKEKRRWTRSRSRSPKKASSKEVDELRTEVDKLKTDIAVLKKAVADPKSDKASNN